MMSRFIVVIAGMALAVALGFLIVSSGPHPNAVPTPESVAARTMSPFCPGLTLDECPSSQAALLRQRIAERVRAGATNQQVDRWLVSNYGPSVLGRPASKASWIVPVIIVSTGAGALAFGLDRWRRSPDAVHATDMPSEAEADEVELHDRFEQEFALYKQASDE